MKCEDALILISGHLDNMNTAEEEADLQAHLSQCEACRELLKQFEQVDFATANLKEKAPEDLCAGVMARIKKETAGKKRRPWLSVAVAAALMVVIGIGAFLPKAEKNREHQPAIVSEAGVVGRSMPVSDAEDLARKISSDRAATVVVVHELYHEIEQYPCQTLEEGYCLYVLPDHNAAVFLSETYGCVIYEPQEQTNETRYYALLAA